MSSSNDERLAQVTVGEVHAHGRAVEIVDYDERWPEWFQREAARIDGALGERARRIEHVGSTAVPGLAAKPVIDIVLVVADSSDEPSYVADLETADYRLHIREPDWFEHRVLKGPDTAINLHVFTAGCPEVDRMIAFRDHLRANSSDRAAYAAVKRELAQHTWRHVQDYADAKGAIVQKIQRSIATSGLQ